MACLVASMRCDTRFFCLPRSTHVTVNTASTAWHLWSPQPSGCRELHLNPEHQQPTCSSRTSLMSSLFIVHPATGCEWPGLLEAPRCQQDHKKQNDP